LSLGSHYTQGTIEPCPYRTNKGLPNKKYRIVKGEKTMSEVQSTATALSNDLPTLKKNTKSEGVRFLQEILVLAYGYKLEIDGIFGPKTETALQDFQIVHNLESEYGFVGVKTWRDISANITDGRS
jgi:peptidoglycan hydrolase-like protein with peptidoglycan-binding domain